VNAVFQGVKRHVRQKASVFYSYVAPPFDPDGPARMPDDEQLSSETVYLLGRKARYTYSRQIHKNGSFPGK
jgi:hypothetical protein